MHNGGGEERGFPPRRFYGSLTYGSGTDSGKGVQVVPPARARSPQTRSAVWAGLRGERQGALQGLSALAAAGAGGAESPRVGALGAWRAGPGEVAGGRE